jgi:hypothetical protein
MYLFLCWLVPLIRTLYIDVWRFLYPLHAISSPTAVIWNKYNTLLRLFDKTPQCVINLYNISTLKFMILTAVLIITPWLWSAIELYRPSDHRLSAKLVPSFVGRRVVSAADPSGRSLDFLGRGCYFFFQVAPQFYLRGSVDMFQTHYLSENLVAPGIGPGSLVL